jgi:ubiquinone/menaquinone biosynthesis C-methylase UbiE
VSVRGFEAVARFYRFAEYLSMGRALQQARVAHLAQLKHAQHVLILGEGDGRFLDALLSLNPQCQVTVIEASPTMIALAKGRTRSQAERVVFHCADIQQLPLLVPDQPRFDALVALFFLDCFDGAELSWVVHEAAQRLTPQGTWLHADFALPRRALPRLLARCWIWILYRVFRSLTDIRARRLIDPAPALVNAGLTLTQESHSLGGMLCSSVYTKRA